MRNVGSCMDCLLTDPCICRRTAHINSTRALRTKGDRFRTTCCDLWPGWVMMRRRTDPAPRTIGGLKTRSPRKGAVPPRATFRDVFAVREFRALWFSEVLSVAGDRLALVALTLLVFYHTHSPLLTAIAYATGYVPWVIGGLFLADVADRRPRRSVMIVCEVVRAVLVGVMAVPHVPIGVLVVLLFAA